MSADVLTTAIAARDNLAALVPDPDNVTPECWPVENSADGVCLYHAYLDLAEVISALRAAADVAPNNGADQ